MTWNNFIFFAIGTLTFWSAGCYMAWKKKYHTESLWIFAAGILLLLSFILGLGIFLQRPPIRTMGETRLLYSFFTAVIGWLIFLRRKYAWLLSLTATIASLFIIINLVTPQIHNQALIPALQSIWFIPHVVVYMLSYALMGCALIFLLYGSISRFREHRLQIAVIADNLVYTGTALLTTGMLLGAIWAKQAWGHYWTWDPKETWAALTWLSYICYIHVRHRYPFRYKSATIILTLSFLFLQICWYGIHYLPAAMKSIHTYHTP